MMMESALEALDNGDIANLEKHHNQPSHTLIEGWNE